MGKISSSKSTIPTFSIKLTNSNALPSIIGSSFPSISTIRSVISKTAKAERKCSIV